MKEVMVMEENQKTMQALIDGMILTNPMLAPPGMAAALEPDATSVTTMPMPTAAREPDATSVTTAYGAAPPTAPAGPS